MKDQIVLITGANGGLGRHVTQAFLAEGATVIGTSPRIRQSDFDASNFTAISADISSLQSAKALVEQVAGKFGKLEIGRSTRTEN